MSKIEKLSIQGVRSFGDKGPEVIQFGTPLTLIVGYNGSGKTTIIECLKYATTGDLPPNSARGGAFIHDPKLVNEKSVLAQVRLSFRSTRGFKMLATRNLQVQLTKTTRKQSTLEAQLVMLKNGERTSISSRVAELDQILPQYLGVSKAILDSVIFCHQDESLWPMSEPAALKKRFDEIFEAQKYTKAVDNIKVLRKKQNDELAKYKLIEAHAKEDKFKGERAEARSSELYDEIERYREQCRELKEQIEEAQQKSNDAYEHAATFEKIVARLEGKRIEAQAIQRSVTELKQNLREMTDTDAELQSHLDQYEERVAQYKEESEVHRQHYSSLSQEMEESRRSLGSKQSEIGKHEAQRDQHERQIEQRETLVKDTARRYNVRGFDLEVNERSVRDFMERIGKMARDQNAAFEKARRETHEDLQKAQTALSQLNERKSALNQNKDNCRSQVTANDRRITNFQNDLNKIKMDEGGKAVLESTIADVEKRLDALKSEETKMNWDSQIHDLNRELQDVDNQKEKLDTELYDATSRAGESARLDLLVKDQKDRQRSLETMTGVHGSKLSTLLGQSWEPATLEQSFQSVLEKKISAKKEAEAQRDGISRELEQLDFKLTTAKESMKKKEQEMKRCEEVIQSVIENDDPSSFLDELVELESSWQIASSDQSSFRQKAEAYRASLKFYEEHNACELCRRGFKPGKESDKFKADLTKKIDKVVKAAEEAAEQDLNEIKSEFENAKKAKPQYDIWSRLSITEIPALSAEVKDLSNNRTDLVSKLEERDQILSEKEDARRDTESYSRTVQQISKYHVEIDAFENQIKELSAKRSQTGASRGLEIIKDDLRKTNGESRSLRTKLTKIQGDRERSRNTISALELEARDVKSRLSTAVYELKERSNLQAQLEDLRSQNNEQREIIRGLDKELQSISPQVEQAQLKYNDIKQRGDDKQRDLQQEASKLSDSLHQLKLVNDDINAYIDRGSEQSLTRTRREIETLETEVSRIEEEQRKTARDIKKIEDSLRNTDDTKRAINDNLRYRRSARDLEAVQIEVAELESHNAETDKAKYDREGHRWSIKRNELSAEQASLTGTMKSKDDQLKQLIKDWHTDYKDAKYKYKEAHIKVETTKAAVEDLGRYGGALDKAIMKYHTLKMEEINRIIDELWRNTYQGTDVDTIVIRSDNEVGKGNKSYNYRVVMVKQDVEMDMRGRCSAGQKMLASIIIRLSLAECFGVNCGLIALDEPTTNLDRDNIQSLARSLASIIKVRRQQANFQLIIITHDDEFLEYMQCGDFADTYFRVSRNEAQKSIIRSQQISNVRLGG